MESAAEIDHRASEQFVKLVFVDVRVHERLLVGLLEEALSRRGALHEFAARPSFLLVPLPGRSGLIAWPECLIEGPEGR